MNWPKIKNIVFEVSSSHCTQQQRTISQSDCDMRKSEIYTYDTWQWLAQWLDWEAPNCFPNTNLHQKKVHSHCLVVCCRSDPLQLSESRQNYYIWGVSSANRCDAPKIATPAASIVQQNGPILHNNSWPHVAKSTLQKLNELVYEVLPHPPYLPDLSPFNYYFFKHLDNF